MWRRLPSVTGGRSPGTESGRGFLGLSLSVRIPGGPKARAFPESCRVFLRVMVAGRDPGAGLRVLSLC